MNEQRWLFPERVDRSAWGDGPWQDEPDKVQWTDDATGLPCLTVRNTMGSWCGYVGVAEGHPLYQVSYGACVYGHEDCYDHAPDGMLEVHGGITFSDMCADDQQPYGVCHIPEPGQPDHVWWLGFDTAHCNDLAPSMAQYYSHERDVYRTLEYVQNECTALARQLAALETVP